MWFPSCSSFSEFAPRPAALPGTADHCKAKSLRADRSWQDPQDPPIISHINFREWARWVRKYIVELLIDLPFTQKPRVFSVMQLYIIVYRITYMYIIYNNNQLCIHIVNTYHMISHVYHVYLRRFLTRLLFFHAVMSALHCLQEYVPWLGSEQLLAPQHGHWHLPNPGHT